MSSSKMYCFGDSYTEGYKNDMSFWPYDAYRHYLKTSAQNMPKIWSEILGDLLDIETYNFAKGGASNQEIFFKICEYANQLKSGDIVIINWTYIQRCLWVIDDVSDDDFSNHLFSISPQQGEYFDKNGLYKNSWNTIAVNRMEFSYTYEIKRYIEIINTLSKSIGFTVYYWFTDDYLFNNISKILNVNTKNFIMNDLIKEYDSSKDERGFCCIPFNIFGKYGAKTIRQDSNNQADDSMHLGGTGHIVQAKFFYSYITNSKYPLQFI